MSAYPQSWEADVVLRDGATARLRPILQSDADGVQAMHSRQSAESIYMRFFAPIKQIPEKDLERFVTVDYRDRVAFVMTIRDEIIGIGRYDRLDENSAEVAFNIADAHQGRGIGSILLEHLAAAAREMGIDRFVAEVLPQNRPMLQVFAAAGYEITREFDDGVVAVAFDIDPTEKSRQVLASREHRAEALSVRGILHPKSIVVFGASRSRASIGNLLLRNLTAGGFRGRLNIVHPKASEVAGLPTVSSLDDIEGDIDVAVIAVPAAAVPQVVRDCAERGVKGVVVISSGFAETSEDGARLQEQVLTTARTWGMRLIGPNSFGVLNSDPDIELNTSLSPFLPDPGHVGVFSQSGALGTAMLAAARERGIGISTFVSAGNRADLSGNDMMQYWQEDPATNVVCLYLESIGNPRKFSRIARRVTRNKPVIVIKSDLTGGELPPGHAVRVSSLSASAMDQVLAQAGVIRARSVSQMYDIAQVFDTQPLPAGKRVGIVGNSAALSTLVEQCVRAEGLKLGTAPVSLHPEATVDDFEAELRQVYANPHVHSVVVIITPSPSVSSSQMAQAIADAAAQSGKTTVACFLGVHGKDEMLTSYTRSETGERTKHVVPSYGGPEAAVWALARATEYAVYKKSDHGHYPIFTDLKSRRARQIIESSLAEADSPRMTMSDEAAHALLDAYGIEVLPYISTATVEEAKEAAAKIGYPVALKAVHKKLRHRFEFGGVRLAIQTEAELVGDWNGIADVIAQSLDDDDDRRIDVQAMAPAGVGCVIRAGEDPLLGPMVSFSIAGDSTELLDDVAHRVAPLTDLDARNMVRTPGASPRLFGYKGLPVANVEPAEEILLRLAALVDDFPVIRSVEVRPIMITTDKSYLLSARIQLAADADRMDTLRRRM